MNKWKFEERDEHIMLLNLESITDKTSPEEFGSYADAKVFLDLDEMTVLEVLTEARERFEGKDWVSKSVQAYEAEMKRLEDESLKTSDPGYYDVQKWVWTQDDKSNWEARLDVLRPLNSPKPVFDEIKNRAMEVLAAFKAIDPAKIEGFRLLEPDNSEAARNARGQYSEIADQLLYLREEAKKIDEAAWAIKMWAVLENMQTA